MAYTLEELFSNGSPPDGFVDLAELTLTMAQTDGRSAFGWQIVQVNANDRTLQLGVPGTPWDYLYLFYSDKDRFQGKPDQITMTLNLLADTSILCRFRNETWGEIIDFSAELVPSEYGDQYVGWAKGIGRDVPGKCLYSFCFNNYRRVPVEIF